MDGATKVGTPGSMGAVPDAKDAAENTSVMDHKIVAAEMGADLILHVRFADGFEGSLPLSTIAWGDYVLGAIMRDPGAVNVLFDGDAIGWLDENGEDVDFGADNLRADMERLITQAAE